MNDDTANRQVIFHVTRIIFMQLSYSELQARTACRCQHFLLAIREIIIRVIGL